MRKVVYVVILLISLAFVGVCFAETSIEATGGTIVVKNMKVTGPGGSGTLRQEGILYGIRGVNYLKISDLLVVRSEVSAFFTDMKDMDKYGFKIASDVKTIALRTALALEGDDSVGFFFGPVWRVTWMDVNFDLVNNPLIKGEGSARISEFYITESFRFKGETGPHRLEFIAEVFIPIDGSSKSEFKNTLGYREEESEYIDLGLGYGIELKYSYKQFLFGARYQVNSAGNLDFYYTTFLAGIIF
ncbi:MAG: hypothetical protein N2257_07990 [Thermodesulfovibrionales bacterium]|nr:hypothetical protein [Thermodesulfovibrionales bacterium]